MEYKINKLYLKNFKFIKDNEIKKIEFGKENLVILGGPNGYGKTTIFDALEIIFKNKIEGIKKITKSRRYLKDSLLLNNGDRSGILGIELVNFNKTISIITKISSIQGHPELDILVQKFYKEENLKIEDIQNFKLKEYKEIKNISEIKGLENFQEKNYNLFNYISQKNYCYYLEKDEEERNQIITELLGLSEIKDYQKYL
ncbi:AAA family ATPase, partial [Cetobacterium sp.]|uniref:AAA family ATPase n=1 Tax=Cetobacterium sp. TaxID=2071632 RepID=UPI003F3C7D2E